MAIINIQHVQLSIIAQKNYDLDDIDNEKSLKPILIQLINRT